MTRGLPCVSHLPPLPQHCMRCTATPTCASSRPHCATKMMPASWRWCRTSPPPPNVGALGALVNTLPDLLTSVAIESPALHAAIASWIGTDAGVAILGEWVKVAPIGQEASHAATLVNAVRCTLCEPWAAVALIVPSDASATLLRETWNIARVVRRWRQTTCDHPTAWAVELTPAERDRMMNTRSNVPAAAAFCLPWLPEKCARCLRRCITRHPHPPWRHPRSAHPTCATRRSQYADAPGGCNGHGCGMDGGRAAPTRQSQKCHPCR